VIKNV